jgi:hypothetical protein
MATVSYPYIRHEGLAWNDCKKQTSELRARRPQQDFFGRVEQRIRDWGNGRRFGLMGRKDTVTVD